MASRSFITTPFTALGTTRDVLEGVDLTGVRAVITGASSGLGAETARALTAAGAGVVLAVRDIAAGDAVADEIRQTSGATRPEVRALDLADRESIARFIGGWEGPLHLLVNNAGIVTGGLERTREGWELQLVGIFVSSSGVRLRGRGHVCSVGVGSR